MPAHGRQHQQHDRQRGGHQVGNQLVGFLGRGHPVIAGHQHFHVGRQCPVTQLIQALANSGGDVDGVLAGLFGNGQGHRRIDFAGLTANRLRMRRAEAGHDALVWHRAATAHLGDVIHVNGRTIVHAHHQPAHIGHRLQQGARLHRNGEIIAGNPRLLAGSVGRLQGLGNVTGSEAETSQQGRIKPDVDTIGHTAHGVDIPGAGHSFERHLQHVGQAGQFFPFLGAGGVVECQGHHRHIVDAPGLDQRLSRAQVRG